jgi:hypothetical protein
LQKKRKIFTIHSVVNDALTDQVLQITGEVRVARGANISLDIIEAHTLLNTSSTLNCKVDLKNWSMVNPN